MDVLFEPPGFREVSLLTELNILLSTNRSYIPLLTVMLHSLFDNNRDCAVNIHLLHAELNEDDLSIVEKTVKRYGGKLCSYRIDVKSLSEAIHKPTEANEDPREKSRLPMETYFRLLCIDYLPKSIKKVLYLDCDVIVNGSLKELYNMDLTDYMFAAADDFLEALELPADHWQRGIIYSHIPETFKYVNAGVLLMNIDRFRQVITTEEIISIIDEHGDLLIWHDQDFINYLFYKYIYHFDYKLYNYFPVYPDWEDLEPGRPVIIHYGGDFKPWNDDYYEKCESIIKVHRGGTSRFARQAKKLYEKYAAFEKAGEIRLIELIDTRKRDNDRLLDSEILRELSNEPLLSGITVGDAIFLRDIVSAIKSGDIQTALDEVFNLAQSEIPDEHAESYLRTAQNICAVREYADGWVMFTKNYIQFLLDKNRDNEALTVIFEMMEIFPDDDELKLLRDQAGV